MSIDLTEASSLTTAIGARKRVHTDKNNKREMFPGRQLSVIRDRNLTSISAALLLQQLLLPLLLILLLVIDSNTKAQELDSRTTTTTGERRPEPARASSPVSGRQNRPLFIEDENAAGGFIMRTLASAVGANSSSGTLAASSEPTNNDEEQRAEITKQETTDTTTTTTTTTSVLVPQAAAENCGNDSQLAKEEDNDRIPIDANRKLFATHDQLNLNGTTSKEEPSDKPQSSRAGLGRLAYASSFLSDFLFRPRFTQQQQQVAPIASTTSRPTTTSGAQQQVSVEDETTTTTNCPGVCLNILSASIRCQKQLQHAVCPIFHKCCELDATPINGGQSVAPGATGGGEQVAQSAFNRTPVETSAPLGPAAGDSDQTNPPPPPETSTQGAWKQQVQEAEFAAAAAATGSKRKQQQETATSDRLHGLSAQTNGGQQHEEPNDTKHSDERTQHVASSANGGAVYFLSSASDSDPATPSGVSNVSAAAAANDDDGDQADGQRSPPGAIEAAATSKFAPERAQASAKGQPGGGVAQSAGEQHALPANGAKHHSAASQSFDTPVSSVDRQTAKGGERIVSLQLANGTTAYLVQDSATTSRPRPIYANWTDYQLLMQTLQQQQAAGRNQQPVVYHSNVETARRPVQQTVDKLSVRVSTDLNSSYHQQQEPSLEAVPTVPVSGDVRVLKDQHSAALVPARRNEPPATISSTSTSTSTTSAPTTIQTTTTSAAQQSSEASEQATIRPAQDQELSGEQQASLAAPLGAGIASLLGTLLDSFLPASSSVQQQQQQPEDTAGDSASDLATGADGAAPSFLAPNFYANDNQHNDRRLGLDLSFRQKQNEVNESLNSVGLMMTSDGGSESTAMAANEGQHRCQGYCALDQFLHLCDSFYVASDCSRTQKCCLSSGAAQASEQQRGQQQRFAQVCRGTCLPLYHSSLCARPNELLVPAPGVCLPSQLCCSPPTADRATMVASDDEGSNHIDLSGDAAQLQSAADKAATSEVASTAHQLASATAKVGSSALAASLVPPPPPTLMSGGGEPMAESVRAQLAPIRQPSDQGQPPVGQQRPATVSKAQISQTSGGGFVNQILSMFKSNSGKQRARAPLAVVQQQQFLEPKLHQQLAMSATGLRPQLIAAAPQQQILFHQAVGPSLAVAASSKQAPMQQYAAQQFVAELPMVANEQKWNSANGASGRQSGLVEQVGGQMALNVQADQVALLQRQMQQYAQLLTAGSQSARPQQQFQPAYQIGPEQQQFAISGLQAQRPIVYQQLPQQQHLTRWPNAGHQDSANSANNAHVSPTVNRAQLQQQQYQSAVGKQQPNRAGQFVNQNLFSPFSAADATHFASQPMATAFNKAPPARSQQQAQFVAQASERAQQQQQQQQQQAGWQQVGGGGAANQPQVSVGGQQQQQQQAPRPEVGDTNIVAAGTPVASGSSWKQANSWPQQPQQRAKGQQQQQQQFSAHSAPSGREQQQPLSSNLSPTISAAEQRWQAPSTLSTASAAAAVPAFVDSSSVAIASDQEEDSAGSELSAETAADTDDTTTTSAVRQGAKPSCPHTCMAPLLSFNCAQPHYVEPAFTCPNAGAICCVKKSSDEQSSPTLSSNADEEEPEESSTVQPNARPQLTTDKPSEGLRNKVLSCGVPGGGAARAGQRATSGKARARVMGGSDAQPGYWCWQAALMNGKNEYLCGGALIGSKWVLTAAHCVTQHLKSESQLYVRLGQWNLNSTSVAERRSARSLPVKTSYVHHNHNGITLDNDVALLRLEHSALAPDLADDGGPQQLDNICTVCLPERSAAVAALEPGRRCTVTGYGYEHESGPAALRVRQTELPIVADAECQNKTSLVLGKPFLLPASSFCAGGELGQDACHGDGGSPLSCQHPEGYYELTGIVSWGYKCGQRDLPGLYAKVSNFVGWINQIVSVNN